VSLDDYIEVVNGQRAGSCDSFRQILKLQPWEGDKVTLELSSHGVLADGG